MGPVKLIEIENTLFLEDVTNLLYKQGMDLELSKQIKNLTVFSVILVLRQFGEVYKNLGNTKSSSHKIESSKHFCQKFIVILQQCIRRNILHVNLRHCSLVCDQHAALNYLLS